MSIPVNKHGEVADYADVSQFETGESAYECGFFSVFLNKATGFPDLGPIHNAEWIDEQADLAYSQYNGANGASNTSGMSVWQLFTLLGSTKQRYVWFTPNLSEIKAWLTIIGTPVLLTVQEESVYDIELGRVPYSWSPSGSHIITVSGIAPDGNFLCRDTASIGTSGVRPGPRHYDAAKLNIGLCVAVLLDWIPDLAAGYNPLANASPYKKAHEYTIQAGDTLGWIAAEKHTSIAHLLASNQATLDNAARADGYLNSDNGNRIFPGTTLIWS